MFSKCLFLATNLWMAASLRPQRRTGALRGCPGSACCRSSPSWRAANTPSTASAAVKQVLTAFNAPLRMFVFLFCIRGLNNSNFTNLFVSGSVTDVSLSESDPTFFCYPPEETLAAEMVETITQSLNNGFHILCCSKLLLPECLMQNLSEELLHLAVNEPCGLRGALIDLCVETGDQGSLCTVDQIAVDPTLVPTFHVTLVLRVESTGLWPKVQKLFKGGKSPCATAQRHHKTLKLSTSFRVIKRKLYSSGELLIEECCWFLTSTQMPF